MDAYTHRAAWSHFRFLMRDGYMMLDYYPIGAVLPVVFLIGLCAGSFVTMASYRLPLGQDIVFRSSHCPECNTTLGFVDLFPLLSWLWQRGKCRHCHAAVGMRYPLTELGLGIAFMVIAALYGLSFNALLLALLATALAVMIVVDLEHYIIPDSVQVAVLLTGLTYRIMNGAGAEDILPGMAGGLVIGLVLHYGYIHLRRKDALGFGDVKFLCVAGSWLPFADFVPFLFFSGLVGIFTGLIRRALRRGELFPFGPALACSMFLNVLVPGMLQRLAS